MYARRPGDAWHKHRQLSCEFFARVVSQLCVILRVGGPLRVLC